MATTTKKPLNLKLIRTDGGTQSRADIDENIVDEYANAMADGDVFPDPVVYYDGTEYWLSEGFHRVAAAKLTQKASLVFEVRSGSRFDALIWSVGANSVHGLRRSNADKRNSVQLLLKEDQSHEWSDQRIADACKVTRQFVGEVRKPEMRAARDEKAKAKATGEKATKRDPVPGSEVGAVKVTKGKSGATVAPVKPLDDAPTEAELADENAIKVLSDEVDRLTKLRAIEVMDATEEEKAAASTMIDDLTHELQALRAERNALSSQLNAYLTENGELKREVLRLRNKLDQATGKTVKRVAHA